MEATTKNNVDKQFTILLVKKHLREYLALDYIFNLFSFLTQSAESFWGRPCVWCGALSVNQAIAVFFSLVLIIAETEPAETDMQPDRLKENVLSLNKGEGRSLIGDLCLSFCEDGWSGIGVIQPEKYNYISKKVHLTN